MAKTEEPSQSLSEGSPQSNVEEISKEFHSASNLKNRSSNIIRFHPKNIETDSPDHASEGWIPSKIRKLSAENNGIQSTAGAIMKKARVSLEAQSEVAMVQRCVEDQSYLTTTYEGNQKHPLLPATVKMAEVAARLLPGSTSSPDGLINPNTSARTGSPYSSSMATISASAPFSTVSLGLNHTPNPSQFQTPSTQFQFPLLNVAHQGFASSAPMTVSQGLSQVLRCQFGGQLLPQQGQPSSLADVLSAATKAVTADPNFIAALASTIGSIAGRAPTDNSTTNINIEWINANNNGNTTNFEDTPKLPAT